MSEIRINNAPLPSLRKIIGIAVRTIPAITNGRN
jgi:hypothetical protein